MFIDQAKVRVRGGKGGDGAISMYREKFIEFGGPDGGRGGRGGSIFSKRRVICQHFSHFAITA